MAYVRKTEEMQDGVLRKIRDMKDKALSAYASNTIEQGTPEFTAAIEAAQVASFREAPELRQSYPEAWKKSTKYSLNVRFKQPDGRDNFSTRLDVESLGVKFPAHVDGGYSSFDVEVYPSDCSEVLKTWLGEADQRNTQRQQIAEQYSTVETQLRHFMAGHASLNSMLKEMPEFEMYVPAKYMSKFHEATKPREKKPQQQSLVEELSIDRDAIAAIAIANRMTT